MNDSADELAIRGLIARYCDAVNRYDSDAWAGTWANDGRWYFLDGVHEAGFRFVTVDLAGYARGSSNPLAMGAD